MSRVLTLQDYYSLINLQPTPFKSQLEQINYEETIRQIVEYFSGPSTSRHSLEQDRAFIRQVLTTREPDPEYRYTMHIYNLIDQMLIYERDHMKSFTLAKDLPVQFNSLPFIRVWRGDITTLAVDAIVNAANSALLGCFQPTHLCIDNVIHAAAGPHLRDDCYTIMQKQQQAEPVGGAKITSGHNLHSKYVLHTVGPQLHRGVNPSENDIKKLTSCYEACLDLATEISTITSIGFCCISTGLFAFPPDQACHIAIKTVLSWYHRKGSTSRLSLIVFDVFSSEDEQRYLNELKKFC